jgi:hypothetical protein
MSQNWWENNRNNDHWDDGWQPLPPKQEINWNAMAEVILIGFFLLLLLVTGCSLSGSMFSW